MLNIGFFNMINLKANIITILFLFFIFTQQLFPQKESIPGVGFINPTHDKSSKSGYYIPKNVKDCINELDKMLPDKVKEDIEISSLNDNMIKYNTVMPWLYLNWDMADTSRIVKYLLDYGFSPETDFSKIIFESYLKYKKGFPLRFEVTPKVYSIGKNLTILRADSIAIPTQNPVPYGSILIDSLDNQPHFIYMGSKFTLIDSLYEPIMNFLKLYGFDPTKNLWYLWWTQIFKFGEGIDSLPYFLTREKFEKYFDTKHAYNADFILVFQDEDSFGPKTIMKDNLYNTSLNEYLKSKNYIGLYLVRHRNVVYLK
ncbi:hypothetical protein D9V86_07110 [Bacteroidetes/Chlorobi group bacterium ChocPot_Mid]|nr:MAG: hypothetical protein D9V86_07110 [Bacteroidetes/Chlorobi group bacterium ChocPot_Mid]